MELQQHLPFTVLKLVDSDRSNDSILNYVATTPTVYGIETIEKLPAKGFFDIYKLQQHLPFTVLKRAVIVLSMHTVMKVATTPTVYGIETCNVRC